MLVQADDGRRVACPGQGRGRRVLGLAEAAPKDQKATTPDEERHKRKDT